MRPFAKGDRVANAGRGECHVDYRHVDLEAEPELQWQERGGIFPTIMKS